MYSITAEQENLLIKKALEARKCAYAPYSGFAVGAALLTQKDTFYLGGNIENASYGATNCAERTAIFKAVSEGCNEFKAIAIAGGPREDEPSDWCYPCGICRQVMQEFCDGDFPVYIVKSTEEYKKLKLSELLPYSFNEEALAGAGKQD